MWHSQKSVYFIFRRVSFKKEILYYGISSSYLDFPSFSFSYLTQSLNEKECRFRRWVSHWSDSQSIQGMRRKKLDVDHKTPIEHDRINEERMSLQNITV